MTQTTNYQLNQWEATDQVKRTDFNADNAKLDAVIAAVDAKADGKAAQSALTALQTVVNGKGNCKIATGTYTGTGTYGYQHSISLNFAGTLGKAPELLIVRGTNGGANALILLRGMTSSFFTLSTSSFGSGSVTVTWTSTGVSWYNSDDRPDCQYNSQGVVYHYVAIG